MTHPPEIALVLASSTGGVGTHVRALVEGLTARGWPVRVCGPAATDDLFGFAAGGATFTPVAVGTRRPLAVPRLRLATARSALVHAHGLRAAAAAALAGRRPLVVTWHNAVLATSAPRRRVLAAGERLVARAATVTLAASPDLAARVRDLGGRDVRDAPVAAPLRRPGREPAGVRAALGLTDGRPLVVSVGRLHPQKGHDTLVDAAVGWPALVVIAGDGPQRADLAERIARTGAPVRLLGRRADTPDLLAAADIVVLASRWEARSLAAQEALALGRPLVATRVGGMPELVGDGAWLVPPDDPAALDAAVRELLGDPARRAELAARGAARAGTWPTVEDTVTQVDALYRELLGVPRRAPSPC